MPPKQVISKKKQEEKLIKRNVEIDQKIARLEACLEALKEQRRTLLLEMIEFVYEEK